MKYLNSFFVCSECGECSAELKRAIQKETCGTSIFYYLECGCGSRTSYYKNYENVIKRSYLIAKNFIDIPDFHKLIVEPIEKKITQNIFMGITQTYTEIIYDLYENEKI